MAGTKRETLRERERLVELIPFQFQLDEKSDFESGRFTGLASVFGSIIDTYPTRTKFAHGAFQNTIRDRTNRVKILLQHDQAAWIGLPTKLEETKEGLLVEASLNKTALGTDTAEAIRHAASLGRLDAVELSIGFVALNEKEEEDKEAKETFRIISDIQLFEISVVAVGADRQTRLLEAASLEATLLPRRSRRGAESCALSLDYATDILEELSGQPNAHPGRIPQSTIQRLEAVHFRLGSVVAGLKVGLPEKAPSEDELAELNALEIELIEADEALTRFELQGAFQP